MKSAPLEVLSERAEGASEMRLADICRALNTSSFQIHVYDSTGIVLVEASSSGNVLMSGCNGQSSAPMQWNGIEVTEERMQPFFALHDLGHLLDEDGLGDDFAKAAAKALGGPNSEYCDNLVSVDTLICHKPFNAAGGVALYYRWDGKSRQVHTPSDNFAQYGLHTGSKTY